MSVCTHKKTTPNGGSLTHFMSSYQPIAGAVKATGVASAAARSSGKL
jgi:hypothetical protein